MRSVVQRVSSASVAIEGAVVGAIGPGLLILLGVAEGDTDADIAWLVPKIAQLRIFEDDAGWMNRSLLDLLATPDFELRSPNSDLRAPAAGALVVSQFTLLASTRKGTRPSFHTAAKPELAIPLYEAFVRQLEQTLGRPVPTGRFGAMMAVSLVNDGPVTLVLDSKTRE
jgi:D-aminoacyl-tRNA deacylase